MTTAPPNGGWKRREYLLRVSTLHCTNCGQSHQTSDLADIYVRDGSGFMEMPRTTRIESGYPVGVSHLQPKDIPVCHQCVDQYALDHPINRLTEDEWRAGLKRKVWQDDGPSPGPSSARPPSPPKPAHPRHPTIDDL